MIRLRAVQLLMLIQLAACGGRGDGEPSPGDGPAGGHVDFVRACGTDIGSEFDAGLESRTVTAGAVSFVPFRVSPIPEHAAVRTFKVQVRTEPGATATVTAATLGTSLLFDEAAFRDDNVYNLDDGTQRVEFTGCPDRTAVFVGAILTTGPQTIALEVTSAGDTRHVTLTALE
jgi:hypothetical protein